ncbi:MAG: YegS/Rv2252/BmrU family lipid kinase [Clostridia bacterium]|nr:YegS/Rv2252/BmrU family lipid kinase [Clostridia bacterium]
MKRLLFVFNPHSGTGVIRKHLAQVLDVFTKAGYEVVAYPTQCSGDGINKIRTEGAEFDRIVVAGGDGMLHEMVNGVMALPKPVETGFIPTGTVNDFAATHHLPKNVVEAAKIAASDNVKALDLGKFGDRYFAYVAAFGIATDVSYKTDQKAKNRFKIWAYVVNIIKCIGPNKFKAACRKMRVDAGDVVFSGEFIFGTISNSKSIGTLHLLVDKKVQLDDGRLEALFIPRPKKLREWIQLYKNLRERDFSKSKLMFVRASEIKLEMEPTAFSLDGENGGEHESIVITAEKQVLKIALPIEAVAETELAASDAAKSKKELQREYKAAKKAARAAEKAQKRQEKSKKKEGE